MKADDREAFRRTDGLILTALMLAIAVFSLAMRSGLDASPDPNAHHGPPHEAGGPFLPMSR
jgi:hypothetical protein